MNQQAAFAGQQQANLAAGRFAHTKYTIKRPFFSFLGRKYHVYAPDGSLVMFVKHPILKLKQEFTIFTDESETDPLITIKARGVFKLNMPMDVFDSKTQEHLGVIKSRGLKSIVRDTWDILDPQDQVVGLFQEDGNSFLRRIFPILTSKHHIELHGETVAQMRQIFHFFVKEFELDLSMNNGRMDPRFAVACAVLALMAEARREQSN